jgi:CheY-like chemotaxis protein
MPLRHVLAVDDDPEVLELLGDIFTTIGHRIEMARSGPEALAKLDWSEFDVVLTDYRMPGMDGYAFAKEARGRHPKLPIVLMTGVNLDRTSPDIAYLMYKPFSVQELKSLMSVVECLVKRPNRSRTSRRSEKEICVLLTRALRLLAAHPDSEQRRRAWMALRVVQARLKEL